MKFGLFGGAKSAGEGAVGDSLGYRHYIDYVLLAEELGYHSVFVVEHHFTGVGQLSASLNFLSLSCRPLQSACGSARPWWCCPGTIRCSLAEQVATLDLVSNGRFDFGIGKGYRETEFSALLHPNRGGHRAVQRDGALLRTVWAAKGARITASAGTSRMSSSSRAVQQPHPPLWMGAGS